MIFSGQKDIGGIRFQQKDTQVVCNFICRKHTYGTIIKTIVKALIRLRGCASWSAPVLFANPRRQVFSRRGPLFLLSSPFKSVFLFYYCLYFFSSCSSLSFLLLWFGILFLFQVVFFSTTVLHSTSTIIFFLLLLSSSYFFSSTTVCFFFLFFFVIFLSSFPSTKYIEYTR